MKLLLYTTLLFCLISTCSYQKNTQNNSHITSFEYLAESRGYYYKLKVDASKYSSQTNREEKEIINTITKKEWNSLIEYTKDLDITTINTLKAPSDKSINDRAAMAQLSITLNGITYTTETFDHGNPPEKIKLLIEAMLDISQ